MEKHAYALLYYCDYPISTGPNKIKVFGCTVYGDHDKEYFILKGQNGSTGRKAH